VAMLLADNGATAPLFTVLLQGGSFALLVYLAVYGLPRFYAEMRAERQDDRDAFTEALARLTDQAVAARQEFLQTLAVQHNAHVERQREWLAQLTQLIQDTRGKER
jgi:hypothetical protein